MTVTSYGQSLEANLQDLCKQVHTGRYRPQPVRRVYIPKADGGRRPLGIPALEDKIVQSAVGEVLAAIYEVDFLDFSYGFRPGRSTHQALSVLQTGLIRQRVNWVLDADIRSFFDSVDHEWMMRVLAVRIADQRVLRLIRQWLKAGVLESGEWSRTEVGTPQGAIISPLLANIFLHYALDIWAYLWRRRHARGEIAIVRYADDFVMGFQYRSDAEAMLAGLKERLGKFGLTLHGKKTRLIEFGRFAAEQRARRGERRPETFDFLGFTHYCGKTRNGRFMVKRKTQSKRMTRKLKELRTRAKQLMHAPVAVQHRWLCSVLRGHYAYYGLPSNFRSMNAFSWEVRRLWYRALRRRERRRTFTWSRFNQMLEGRFPLPQPKITHPWRPA
jgi:group II intron reverse transcriptase/maturase